MESKKYQTIYSSLRKREKESTLAFFSQKHKNPSISTLSGSDVNWTVFAGDCFLWNLLKREAGALFYLAADRFDFIRR